MQFDSKLLPGFYQFRASAVTLIIANAIPLLGVLFWGWDAFSIVALYWVENVVIGGINVLKMIACRPDEKAIDWSKLGSPDKVAEFKKALDVHGDTVGAAKLFHHSVKFFLVPFFIFHYGLFCVGHGVFVFTLFGRDEFGSSFGPFGPLSNIIDVFKEQHLGWAVAGLTISHLYSFFVNYLGAGEYRRTFVVWLMFQPYARVVVLHIAIIFGGFLAMVLGSGTGVLFILVLGKTVLDLHFHLFERLRDSAKTSKATLPGSVLDESKLQ